jgi:hypothetical protein
MLSSVSKRWMPACPKTACLKLTLWRTSGLLRRTKFLEETDPVLTRRLFRDFTILMRGYHQAADQQGDGAVVVERSRVREDVHVPAGHQQLPVAQQVVGLEVPAAQRLDGVAFQLGDGRELLVVFEGLVDLA